MFRGILKDKSVDINNFQKFIDPFILSNIFFLITGNEIIFNFNYFIILFINVLILNTQRIYKSYRVKNIKQILPNIFFISCSITLNSVFNQNKNLISNDEVAKFFLICFIYLSIHHFILRLFLRYLRSKGFNTRKAIFIGNKKSFKLINKQLKDSPWLGYKLDYWFTPNKNDLLKEDLNIYDLKDAGEIDDLIELINSKGIDVDKLFYCNDHSDEYSLNEILKIIGDSCLSSSFLINWDVSSLSLQKEYYGEIVGLNLWNPETSLINQKIKRIFDLILASILFILFLPIFLITSLAIKVTSKGPIFYSQRRYGLNGNLFNMYKFRSMFIEKKISKPLIQAKFNDERITKVGRFIRKYCIDELPQLINVIKGEMSLVGPRPHAIEHNEYYRKLITGYMQRHSKLPGMTGLAQTSGARGETSDIELMKKRIKFDIEYNNNWNLGKDFIILIKTIFTVISGRSY